MIELSGYGILANAGLKHIEYPLHHFGGALVDHQMVTVMGILTVTIAAERPNKLPLLALGVERAPYFPGNIPGVLGIEYVLYRQQHVICALIAVDIVIDGNEAHTLHGQYPLQILACIYVVTAKAAQILDYDAVHLATVHIFHHADKGRSVKIGAGIAVIDVLLGYFHIIRPAAIAFQQVYLIGNAVAFGLISVITGQPCVQCALIHLLCQLFYLPGYAYTLVPFSEWALISSASTCSGLLSPEKFLITVNSRLFFFLLLLLASIIHFLLFTS